LSSQLNHYQEGDGPSCCYAILILEFTPSYWTLLATQTPARGTTSSECAAAGGPTGEALVRPQLPVSRAPGGTPKAKAISSQPQKIKGQISSLRYEQHRYEQHTTAHKPQVFKQPTRAICV